MKAKSSDRPSLREQFDVLYEHLIEEHKRQLERLDKALVFAFALEREGFANVRLCSIRGGWYQVDILDLPRIAKLAESRLEETSKDVWDEKTIVVTYKVAHGDFEGMQVRTLVVLDANSKCKIVKHDAPGYSYNSIACDV